MTRVERVRALKALANQLVTQLAGLFDDMERESAREDRIAAMLADEAVAPEPPQPNPTGPVEPSSPTDLDGIWRLYKVAVDGTGILAAVAFGIFEHETNYGKSKLWREAANPGGIHDSTLFNYDTYVAASNPEEGVVVYEKFPSMRIGVGAHLALLSKERYRGAWGLLLPAQVKAIQVAGYVAGDQAKLDDWVSGVTTLAEQAARERS